MDGLYSFRTILAKVLALIGFGVLIVLIITAIVLGVSKAPQVLSSLSQTFERVSGIRSQNTQEPLPLLLSVASTTLAEGESTRVSWETLSLSRTLTIACEENTTFTITFDSSTSSQPFVCNTPLMIPDTTQSATVTHTASDAGIGDSILTLKDTESETETSVTLTRIGGAVVSQDTVVTQETQEPEAREESVFPLYKPQTAENTTREFESAAPSLDTGVASAQTRQVPSGSDLSVRFTHVGRIEDGRFVFTSTYTEGMRNATRVRVQNIGTRTSAPWSVSIRLPDGTFYRSQTETPLRSGEYADFIVDFSLQNVSRAIGTIETTVTTSGDSNTLNNTSQWSVYVNE